MGSIYDMREELYKEFISSGTTEQQEKDSPLEVIIKDNSLDVNRIIEYKEESNNFKFDFKPEKWIEFIGQSEAKERAKFLVKKVKKGLKSHFLVDGIKGHGKTTFIELFAKDLDAHLIKRIGKQINEDNLVDIINEINCSKKQNVVFFCDEIDSMDWKIIKMLNPILENFEISGKNIKPFIFAGATINKHILIKNNPDTLDRIPTHIKFVRYDYKELSVILKQYKDHLYQDEQVSNEAYKLIAKNSKYNPRTAIALLCDYIVENNIDKILKCWGVVKDGLTIVDIKILNTLYASKRALGANCLALKCGLSEKEYLTEVEPFLLEFGYINRVPSRIITEKGKGFLNAINI